LSKKMAIPITLPPIHPNPSDIINLLPPVAHINDPSTSICDYFVHTSINKERSPTRVVQWTPDARRLLTGNDKGQFTLWNGASFNYESITQVHDDSIRSMAYSHNGTALVSTDKAGTIKYFTPHLTNIHGFQGHREACHGISWSPNDERFVTGGDDGLVKIWNYRAASSERELAGHGWDVRCVDWHPTKGLVVSGSKDMLVKFWDPRTGKDLSTLHSHKAVVNAASWNPEGHIVATAGGDGYIRLFDIRTFRELEALKGAKEVNTLAWHPIHHNLLASGDAGGAIAYWSLMAPDPSKPVTLLEAAHDDAVFSLSFHPLGHILCSGSKDFTARFWCRARPGGGHEIDRYHLGEEGAFRAEAEEATKSRWPNLPLEDKPAPPGIGGVPGLPGLGAKPAIPSGNSTPTRGPPGPPGLSGPPGLARGPGTGTPPLPPPGIGRGPLPPQGQAGPQRRQWGRDAPPPPPGRFDAGPPGRGFDGPPGGGPRGFDQPPGRFDRDGPRGFDRDPRRQHGQQGGPGGQQGFGQNGYGQRPGFGGPGGPGGPGGGGPGGQGPPGGQGFRGGPNQRGGYGGYQQQQYGRR
jgi:polyadenylation factor subunit 2